MGEYFREADSEGTISDRFCSMLPTVEIHLSRAQLYTINADVDGAKGPESFGTFGTMGARIAEFQGLRLDECWRCIVQRVNMYLQTMKAAKS
jgi:hypothetical protein